MRIKILISIIIFCSLLIGNEANAMVNYMRPDGENDYYQNAPEIVMKHTEDGIMRYRLEDANGKVLSGRLDASMSIVTIQSGILKEGENVLDTWLEEANGNLVEGSMERIKFLVDQTPPQSPLKFYLDDVLEISAKDMTSGVFGIYYALEEETFQFVKGDRVFLSLPDGFVGKVCAYAIDYAGNIGEKSYFTIENKVEESERLPEKVEKEPEDEEKPLIEVTGIPEGNITSQKVRITCNVTDNEKVTQLKGTIIYKNEEEKEESLEITEWKKNEQGYEFQRELEEDGIYQICVEAQDEIGNIEQYKGHMILDSKEPVISHIKDLEGKQMTEFVWKYKAEEIVSDLTSFTCEARLDGILCKYNQVYKEPGIHLLEITATDLAGNQVKEFAKFSISDSQKIETTVEHTEELKEDEVNLLSKKRIANRVYVSEGSQEVESEAKPDMLPICIGISAGILLMILLGIVVRKKGNIAK